MMENISYKLDQFEGPLDLLLTLVGKNKINIDDIPIFELCEQYMEYINAEENRDIEIASEFLVMASELMLIKSRMLLPKKEDEEDPRASLAAAMLEYQRTKLAAAKMNLMYATYGLRMVKEQDEISVDTTYVAPHDASLLARALSRALSEVKVRDDRVIEKFEPIVNRRQVPVSAVVSELLRYMRRDGYVFLDTYFTASVSRSELIAKFMAVLELLRQGCVGITEDAVEPEDGIIHVDRHISLEMADNFDEDRINELFKDEENLVDSDNQNDRR